MTLFTPHSSLSHPTTTSTPGHLEAPVTVAGVVEDAVAAGCPWVAPVAQGALVKLWGWG